MSELSPHLKVFRTSCAGRRSWLMLVPVLVLIAWLGIRSLDIDTLTNDEWWSVRVAGGDPYGPIPLSQTLERIAAEDAGWVTPGYFVLLNGWGRFVGWMDFASRALSLLLGVLSIAMTYRLGRDLYSPFAGLAAAILMGTSAFYIDYLHELRMYTLYVLFTVLCIWAYWRLVTCPRVKPFALGLFLLSTAGLLYTHYFAVLPLAGLGVYHLFFAAKRDARRWLLPGVIVAAAALSFLPWLNVALQAVKLADNVSELRRAIAVPNETIPQNTLYMFSNGSVALFAVMALSALRVRRRVVALTIILAISVVVLAISVNLVLGLVNGYRYLLAAWPALALLAAIGLDRLARDGLHPIFILSVWVATCLWVTFDPTTARSLSPLHTRLPWDVLSQNIASHLKSSDTLVYLLPRPASAESAEKPSGYYLYGLPGMPDNLRLLESPTLRPPDQSTFTKDVEQIAAQAKRLWIAFDPLQQDQTDHRAPLDRVLINNHVLCATVADVPRLHLTVYAPLPDKQHSLIFDEKVTLDLLVPIPDVIDRGDVGNTTLEVMLGSAIKGDIPPYTYSVALLLMDANGQVVRQGDYGLPYEPFACHYGRLDLMGLPAGEYSLQTAIYQWQNGGRMSGKSLESDDTGELLPLWRGRIQ